MTDENANPVQEQSRQDAHRPDEQPAPLPSNQVQQPASQQPDPTQQPGLAQQAPAQQTDPALQQPAYQQPVYQQPMQGQPQQAYQQPMQGQQFYQQPPVQGAYGQPPQQAWGQPPAPPQSKRATAALVCGILAIVCSPSVIIGIALGVVALVLVLTPKGQPRDGKMKAGMICGIVGLVLSVAMAVGLAVAHTMAVQEAQRQAAIEAARVPLYKQVEGTVIADDKVCTMKITKMEINLSGDLAVYFTLSNNMPGGKPLDLTTVRGEAWEVNGQKVSCTCFTIVNPGETKEDYFVIPESYLPVNNIEDVESVYGNLEVDPGTGIPMPYTVDLY